VPRLEGEKSGGKNLAVEGAIVALAIAGALWYALRGNNTDPVTDAGTTATENTANATTNPRPHLVKESATQHLVQQLPTPQAPVTQQTATQLTPTQ
jgi:hypothetical protein